MKQAHSFSHEVITLALRLWLTLAIGIGLGIVVATRLHGSGTSESSALQVGFVTMVVFFVLSEAFYRTGWSPWKFVPNVMSNPLALLVNVCRKSTVLEKVGSGYNAKSAWTFGRLGSTPDRLERSLVVLEQQLVRSLVVLEQRLDRSLVVLEQQLDRWKGCVRQAEREKQQVVLRFAGASDEQVVWVYARRAAELDIDIERFHSIVAQLEVQRNKILALVGVIEAWKMAADDEEIEGIELEVQSILQTMRAGSSAKDKPLTSEEKEVDQL